MVDPIRPVIDRVKATRERFRSDDESTREVCEHCGYHKLPGDMCETCGSSERTARKIQELRERVRGDE